MLRKVKAYLLGFALVLPAIAAGQSNGVWLESLDKNRADAMQLAAGSVSYHTALWPNYTLDALPEKDTINLLPLNLSKKAGKVNFRIIPIIQAMGGYESQNFKANDQKNTRGFFYQIGGGAALLVGNQKNWEFFVSGYYEAQDNPGYIHKYTLNTGMIPSMGIAHARGKGTEFTRWDGYFRLYPTSFLTFELGRGKQFIGEGYRSLLVSDFASPGNYFRLNVNVWHLNFSATWLSLDDASENPSGQWQYRRKYMARHYLSWNISKSVNVGFFETVIWQATNAEVYRGFDVHYANPLALYRPVEFATGSADNALMGLQAKVTFGKYWTVYGQFVLDEFLLSEMRSASGWWGNKYGYQIGIKRNGERTFLRAEFNAVRPYTYSHGSVKQNYAHLHESMAHPLGANFYEVLGQVAHRFGSFFRVEFLGLYYVKGDDPEGVNNGGDIFKSYVNPEKVYDNYIGQGIRREVFLGRLSGHYRFNDVLNLEVVGGFQLRLESIEGVNETASMVYLGVTSRIWNRNTDF
jgi:hypothetical protein